jgi:hypothetical protein
MAYMIHTCMEVNISSAIAVTSHVRIKKMVPDMV